MTNPKSTSGKRRRLGKGLHAIVGAGQPAPDTKQNTNNSSSSVGPSGSGDDVGERVALIPLEKIDPGRHQPRTRFDAGALSALAESIRAVGVIQPIVVRRSSEPGRYELIAGERRWRASKLAGLDEIPSIVREADERSAAEAALVENLQREDLNPIERAEGLRGLIDRFGQTQQEVALRVGIDRSSVSNLLRLLDLEPEIRDMLEVGGLGVGHGKALLSVSPGELRIGIARRACREGWSVRRLEAEASRSGGAAGADPVLVEPGTIEMRDLEKRLGEHLGTKVKVRAGRNGRGVLVISFFDLDHFDDLMSRIGFGVSGEI